MRRYTAAFSKSPAVLNSIATFTALGTNQYQVNTEGTKLAFGQIHYRLELFVQSKAPDGMDIDRYANFDWLDPKDAPDDKTVFDRIQDDDPGDRSARQSAARRSLRRPRAAHRPRRRRLLPRSFRPPRRRLPPEGHQRRPDLHQQNRRTDSCRISFPSRTIPPKRRFNGQMLLGNYPFDDEGVPAAERPARRSRRAENFSDVALAARRHSAVERPRPPPIGLRARRAPGKPDRLQLEDRDRTPSCAKSSSSW